MPATMEDRKTKPAEPASTVEPFGVECDAPRNNDILLQCIPGARLRSAISASKPVMDSRTGDMMIPPDQAAFLGQFPPIPGMQLHVNPAKLSYAIVDPLAEDEDLCDRIRLSLEKTTQFRSKGKVKGLPPQRGTLDVHRMKSLVREMLWLLGSDHARVIKGSAPSMEQVERMPGHFMLNPGSRVANTQPRFERDFEAWVEKLASAGG